MSKLNRSLIGLGIISSPVALAIGLGDINVTSSLGQPFHAEVPIVSSGKFDTKHWHVNLANKSEFDKVGLERANYLEKLQFRFVTHKDGKTFIHIDSKQPFKRPIFNVLLNVSGNDGKFFKAFTAFVDPVDYGSETSEVVVEKPATPTAPKTAHKTTATTATAAAKTAHHTTPKPIATKTAHHTTAAPTATKTAHQTAAPTKPQTVTVHSRESLWHVAKQFKPKGNFTVQQVELAFLKENPNAFIDHNINGLKTNVVLKVPSVESIKSIPKDTVIKVVTAQNSAWQHRHHTAHTTSKPTQTAHTTTTPAAKKAEHNLIQSDPSDPYEQVATVSVPSSVVLQTKNQDIVDEEARIDVPMLMAIEDEPNAFEQHVASFEHQQAAAARANQLANLKLKEFEHQTQELQVLVARKNEEIHHLQNQITSIEHKLVRNENAAEKLALLQSQQFKAKVAATPKVDMVTHVEAGGFNPFWGAAYGALIAFGGFFGGLGWSRFRRRYELLPNQTPEVSLEFDKDEEPQTEEMISTNDIEVVEATESFQAANSEPEAVDFDAQIEKAQELFNNGDHDGARDALKDVLTEGSDEQKQRAFTILGSLSAGE